MAIFYACTKDNLSVNSGSESGFAAAQNEVVGQTLTTNVYTDAHSAGLERMPQMGMDGMGKNPMIFPMHHLPPCATITQSGTTFPKTITIDYGTGCSGKGDREMKGKVIIEMTDTIINEGAISTITFQDVYIGGNKLENSIITVNQGQNDAGHWVIATDSKQTITKEDGTVVIRNFNEIQEWVSGFDTADKSDDVFYRSGSGSVSESDGTTYSRSITQPLLIDNSCHYIKSGIIELNNAGSMTYIDFGSGECDNIAKVTNDSLSENINLDEFKFRDGFDMGLGKGKGHGKGHGQGQGDGQKKGKH